MPSSVSRGKSPPSRQPPYLFLSGSKQSVPSGGRWASHAGRRAPGTTRSVSGPRSSCKGAENTGWVGARQEGPAGAASAGGACRAAPGSNPPFPWSFQRGNHSTGLRALQGGGLWGHSQRDLLAPPKTGSAWPLLSGLAKWAPVDRGDRSLPTPTPTPAAQLFAP